MFRIVPAAIAALILIHTPCRAQDTRFELGQRLRAFESEWDRVTDAAARKRTLPHLKRATISFFTFNLAEAARGLDLARLSLNGGKEPEEDVLWAESCVLKPACRLVVAGEKLPFTLQRLYRPRGDVPKGIRLQLSLVPHAGKPPLPGKGYPVAELPLKDSMALEKIPEGDYHLVVEVQRRGKTLAISRQTVSIIVGLTERLEKLDKAVASFADRKTTDSLTARGLVEVLQRLVKGETLETNYPAARLLAELEGLAENLKTAKPFHGKDRPGQFWITVAAGRRAVPVRVQVPEKAKDGKPLPLVLALHGAGGSENMFFDGYGNGAIAKLAAERGWLLVTTRNGLTDGLLEELAKLYPVDRKKVFLVGHSMGAGQALAAAGRDPAQYAGVAALGGGGGIRISDALTKVGFYVGVGKEDTLALRGARALKGSLEKAKVEKLICKEFDDIEHLVIVQLCLPEVFRFFDDLAKR